jgi:hypothetical protein
MSKLTATAAALILLLSLATPLHAGELPDAPRPRSWRVLAIVSEGAMLSDIVTTERLKENMRFFREEDPIARPFVLAPAPVAVVSFVAYATAVNVLSLRMGESRSRTVRRLSWAPQVLQASLNIAGAIHNQSVFDRHHREIRGVYMTPVPVAPTAPTAPPVLHLP